MEDVLVKVDKLIFPADFVILDFEQDKKILIILMCFCLFCAEFVVEVRMQFSIVFSGF